MGKIVREDQGYRLDGPEEDQQTKISESGLRYEDVGTRITGNATIL